jgi:hypothetical protein
VDVTVPRTATDRLQPLLTKRWPTPEGLLAWITDITGHRIPSRAVCEAHRAPFAFVADLFFHETDDALVMANRGGGKTEDVAALHLANGKFKPGFDTSHIGAINIQAKRCYRYYRKGLRHPTLRREAPDPHIGETNWKNGSAIEILPGTEAQTQGGHPGLVAFDEVESGKLQPYENAKSMPVEWTDEAGGRHTGQFLATSTRVTSLGMMQHALEEAEENDTPIYTWCIFETMEPCDGQDGRPACAGAECPLWQWCEGRAQHADGWRSLADIIATYRRVSLDTWEAQHLCLKPEAKALIYANFTADNVSELAEYQEGAGPVLVAYDWGFTDPYHIGLMQYRDGVYYQFDELLGTETSEREVVREMVRRIIALPGYDGPSLEEWEEVWVSKKPWPKPWPKVWPDLAAGDPSAVQLRAELKAHGISARKPATVKHEVEAGQDVLRAAISTAGGLRRYIVHPRNTVTLRGLRNYRAKELDDGSFDPRPDPDPANHRFSHPCDAARYLMWCQRRALGLGGDGGNDDDS